MNKADEYINSSPIKIPTWRNKKNFAHTIRQVISHHYDNRAVFVRGNYVIIEKKTPFSLKNGPMYKALVEDMSVRFIDTKGKRSCIRHFSQVHGFKVSFKKDGEYAVARVL